MRPGVPVLKELRLQGEAAADAESRTQALKAMRGAMSLMTMVAAVLPDAAAEQLEVTLQVPAAVPCSAAPASGETLPCKCRACEIAMGP